jgi:peptidoglycan hydrolase-like protein with peptidoglycan-binding domain
MSVEQSFFTAVLPIAVEVHVRTQGRMFPETLLVQFADETGFHIEGCSKGNPGWNGALNYAGISPRGTIADFQTKEAFIESYVGCITQNDYGFPAVLQSTNPILQMTRLGRSEWAGSQYDYNRTGRPGIDLVNIYTAHHDIINALVARSGTDAPIYLPSFPTLGVGTIGDSVKELQHELGSVAVDGVFGPHTLEAVKLFQHNHGLVVDGIVGPKTWAALHTVGCTDGTEKV